MYLRVLHFIRTDERFTKGIHDVEGVVQQMCFYPSLNNTLYAFNGTDIVVVIPAQHSISFDVLAKFTNLLVYKIASRFRKPGVQSAVSGIFQTHFI